VSANWFIALAAPSDAWFSSIAAPPSGVRMFVASDLHITVAFLGPVGQLRAEAAFAIAPRWPTGPFDITLGAVEPMGNPRRPGALSVRVVEGAEALSRTIADVRELMWERAGARRDDRPPLPHVTIARPRRSAGGSERAAAIAWARSIQLGAPRITLFELVLYTHAEDRSERLFRLHSHHEFDRQIR